MLTPATPELLAELDRALRPGTPSPFAALLDVAAVHADTAAGRRTTQALGTYARTALPPLLRRLLAVETELRLLRTKVAEHVAAADQGHDPTPTDLMEDLQRAGVDLGADVKEAAEVLEAQAYAAAIG